MKTLLFLLLFVSVASAQYTLVNTTEGQMFLNDPRLKNSGVLSTANGGVPSSASTDSAKILMSNGSNIAPSWISTATLPTVAKFVSLGDSSTTSASNVNATGFSFPIAANEKWQVEYGIIDSGIIQVGINAPSGAAVTGQSVGAQVSITTVDGQTSALTNKPVFVSAEITNGSTAGTVQLRYSTSTTAIIRKNSYMRATKMN